MKALYSALCGLLVAGFCGISPARGQVPTNDDPCGAVVLTQQATLCTTPTVGNNVLATVTTANGYTNTGPQCTGGNGGAVPEVWYQFTRTALGATVTVTGNAASKIRLFSAPNCAGPFAEVACSAAATANTTAPALTVANLSLSTGVLFVAVSSSGLGQGGPFTICVTEGPGIVLCPNPTLSQPTYTSAAHTAAAFTLTTAANNAGPYTATLLITGTSVPVQSFVVTPPSFTVSGLVPGTDYTLGVGGTCTTGGLVSAGVQFTPPPANDEPCTAQPLAVDLGTGCTPVLGATRGATVTTPNGYANPGCAGTRTPYDVWYTFRTVGSGPGSTSAVVTVSNEYAARQVRLFAAPSCAGPFAELACADSTGQRLGAAPLVATGLVPNTTYYVSVTGAGSPPPASATSTAVGFFTICVSAQSPVLPCPTSSQLNILPGSLASTSAVMTITPVSGSAPPISYTLTYTPAGGSPVVLTIPYRLAPVATRPLYTAALLTGLLPGASYSVSVVANCAGGGVSGTTTTSFTTPPAGSPAPPNDFCGSALPLPLNTSCVATVSTNLNATTLDPTSGPYLSISPSCGLNPLNDVWFAVVVPPSGIVQVTTGPVSGSATTSTGMALYKGACGSLLETGCDSGQPFAQVRCTGLVPASTVYARVWRQGAGTGLFTVCATTEPACPVASNFLAAALTPTSATLTFTLPASGGTTFTLTYTPAGGAAQTQPVSGSPVALTGLLPGTTYAAVLTSSCSGGVPSRVLVSFQTPSLPTCAAPGVVYTSNLSATAAGVGFVLNPAANSYTLTYQPAGGPPQTLNPTASPVLLTGLTPGMAYTVCVASNCVNSLISTATCATSFRTLLTARSQTGAGQLVVYPNPNHGSATLIAPASLLQPTTVLIVTDAIGRVVQQKRVVPASIQTGEKTKVDLDFSLLPRGLYLLRLETKSGFLSEKILVE